MTANPKIGVEQLLSNYLALHPNAGQPATKQQSADNDWFEQLVFMGMRGGRSREEAEQRARQTIERYPQQRQPQHRQPQQSTGGDWESRLEFIKQYARSGCA